MIIPIAIIVYFILIALSIFCIIGLKNLTQFVKKHKEEIDKLDKELYKDLRMVQYKAMDITKQANKYTKKDAFSSLMSEAASTLALALLPYKKLKSIIYLHKIGKKCCGFRQS